MGLTAAQKTKAAAKRKASQERKAAAKKREARLTVGRTYRRKAHPDCFLKILEIHRDAGTVTMLDGEGYRRLFHRKQIEGLLERASFRDAKEAFKGVRKREHPRLTEYSTSPPEFTPETAAAQRRGVSSADLARESLRYHESAEERISKGGKPTPEDIYRISTAAESTEFLAGIYGLSTGAISKLRKSENVSLDWSSAELKTLGRGLVSAERIAEVEAAEKVLADRKEARCVA